VRGGINLARDMDRWRDIVNTVINHQGPQNPGNSPDEQWQLLQTNCSKRFVAYGLQQPTHSGVSISLNDRQNVLYIMVPLSPVRLRNSSRKAQQEASHYAVLSSTPLSRPS